MRRETKINAICIAVALILVIGMWVWIYLAITALSRIEVEKKTWYPGEPILMIQGNSLMAISEPVYLQRFGSIYAVITAYTPREEECGPNPEITASGRRVRKGYVACPYWIPFGKQVEIDGEIYECQDRMSKKYPERFDILMFDLAEAKQFGRQTKEVILYK